MQLEEVALESLSCGFVNLPRRWDVSDIPKNDTCSDPFFREKRVGTVNVSGGWCGSAGRCGLGGGDSKESPCLPLGVWNG